MILVDSSVWIDHLKVPNQALADLMDRERLLMHPMVIGEVALGSLRDRAEVLGRLSQLPSARIASHQHVMLMIEGRRLFGSGIGYVDAHLLASARVTPECGLWTRDKRLRAAAERMDLFREPVEEAGGV